MNLELSVANIGRSASIILLELDFGITWQNINLHGLR